MLTVLHRRALLRCTRAIPLATRGLCAPPPAWRTYESGLRFRDLNEPADTAALAEDGKLVSVHYTGRVAETGEVFDTSLFDEVDATLGGTLKAGEADDLCGWDRGHPLEFELGAGRVIAGWDEGVHGMRVGGRRELVVPPALAYGAEGSGDQIPPNATLTFEVELLDVREPPGFLDRLFYKKLV